MMHRMCRTVRSAAFIGLCCAVLLVGAACGRKPEAPSGATGEAPKETGGGEMPAAARPAAPAASPLPVAAGFNGRPGAWNQLDADPVSLAGGQPPGVTEAGEPGGPAGSGEPAMDPGRRTCGIDANRSGVFVASADGTVSAWDRDTGGCRWTSGAGAGVCTAPPLLARTAGLDREGGLVLVVPRSDGVEGLDAATGKRLWTYRLGSAPASPEPATAEQAGAEAAEKRPARQYPCPVAMVEAVARDRRFVAVWERSGTIVLLDVETGSTVGAASAGADGVSLAAWQDRLYGSTADGRIIDIDLVPVLAAVSTRPAGSGQAGAGAGEAGQSAAGGTSGGVVGSGVAWAGIAAQATTGQACFLVVGRDRVFALGRDGSFWRFSRSGLVPAGRTGPVFDGRAGMAFDGTNAYLFEKPDGGKTALVSLDLAEGVTAGEAAGRFGANWRLPLSLSAPFAPVVVKGTVYAADPAGTIVSVDTRSGEAVASVATGTRLAGPPVPVGGERGYLAVPRADGSVVMYGAGGQVGREGAAVTGPGSAAGPESVSPFAPADPGPVAANLGRYSVGRKAVAVGDIRFDGIDSLALVRFDVPFTVFRFVPAASGRYRVFSPEADFIPSVIVIMDDSGGELGVTSDDMGPVRVISQQFEAGRTYYIACGPGRDWAAGKSVRLVVK